mmetsp:Transcript_47490/g.110711  ORF Transcript_47490/g.110711 Transcript_47490/m.110711 type:complete len:204 (-) Transcript_47490:674-1285(-)
MRPEDIVDGVWHLELAIVVAQLFTCGCSLICTQWCTMCVMAISLVWGAIANDSLHLNEGRLVLASFGFLNGLPQTLHISVSIFHCQHLPAVCLIALANVLGKGKVSVAIDGDAIVIVESNEFSQTQVASVSARFVGNTFLHATITKDAIGVVVNEWQVRFVVNGCQMSFGCCQPDCVGDTHPQRACGDLNAFCHEVLRVARRF